MLKVSLFVVLCSVLCAGVVLAKEEAASKSATTLDNLMAAFNGESNANAKYLAFAKKADEEGYGAVASLFRAAAQAEEIHFKRHAKVIESLGGKAKAEIVQASVKTTAENLQNAIDGETYESKVMYPGFLAKAKKDKIADAIDAFEDAMSAEKVHADLYKNALKNLAKMKGAAKEYFLCPKCGNIEKAIPGPSCPICMFDTKKFISVK
ncbi:MAG: rubrerythrin family protein [Candidatus Omnitrophica bacterium]|nr:rubrerythrin family protein [Candidatus Omnitrophota bacterium]